MNESQVLLEVLTQSCQVVERDAVPEPPTTPASEKSFALRARDGAIGRTVVGQLEAVGPRYAEALEAAFAAALRIRWDSGVRPRVDEDSMRREDSVNLS